MSVWMCVCPPKKYCKTPAKNLIEHKKKEEEIRLEEEKMKEIWTPVPTKLRPPLQKIVWPPLQKKIVEFTLAKCLLFPITEHIKGCKINGTKVDISDESIFFNTHYFFLL